MSQLRALRPIDALTLYRWRNQERLKAISTTPAPTWEEHATWYGRLKPGEGWIYEIGFQSVGFVHFKPSGIWSIYVGEESAPPRTGTKMAIEALNWYFTHSGKDEVKSIVLTSNIPSIKFHQKLGFTEIESHNPNQVYFKLTKDTWTSVSLPALKEKNY